MPIITGTDVVRLYTDGGLVGHNPSSEGGTWAWCGLNMYGRRCRTGMGKITPAALGMATVSNNLTEFLAALHALEAMTDGWKGALATDSLVTRLRVQQSPKQAKLKNIPPGLCERLAQVKARLGMYAVFLLGGHPSKRDLAQGCRQKDGMPVSVHNRWCDTQCKTLAKYFYYPLQEESHDQSNL